MGKTWFHSSCKRCEVDVGGREGVNLYHSNSPLGVRTPDVLTSHSSFVRTFLSTPITSPSCLHLGELRMRLCLHDVAPTCSYGNHIFCACFFFSLSYSEGNPNKVKPFHCDEARDLVIQGKKKLKRKKSESFVLMKS